MVDTAGLTIPGKIFHGGDFATTGSAALTVARQKSRPSARLIAYETARRRSAVGTNDLSYPPLDISRWPPHEKRRRWYNVSGY